MSNKNNPQGMNRETNKGWYEDKNPLTDKAPVHQKVALKNEFEKHGFKDATAIVPSIKSKDKEEQNIISICLSIKEEDRSKFDEATEKFVKKHDVEVETKANGDKVTVKLPVEHLEDFVSFIDENAGFKLDSGEEEQVKTILEKDDVKTGKTDKKDGDKENAVDDGRSNTTAHPERKEDD